MNVLTSNNRKIRINTFGVLISLLLTITYSCSGDKFEPNEPVDPDPNAVDSIATDPVDTSSVVILNKEDVPDFDKIYQANEFKDIDFLRGDSQWSFVRSKQSEHFIVFWEEGFGDDPGADDVPDIVRVDVDDVLERAEEYYDTNVNVLQFAEVGAGKSNLDRYKLQIYLHYQSTWMAYGSGYDDVVGAIWVNPAACNSKTNTLAHEIAHTFQYMVYVDLINYGGVANEFKRGFRYGYGGYPGNTYWEQCAQWQSFYSVPSSLFSSSDFSNYTNNYHRHFCHEFYLYASYFLNYYWADKHGDNIVGKIWREAIYPEDPIETYMRINDLSLDEFYAELYEASARFVTWDLEALREKGKRFIGNQEYNCYQLTDGGYQVSYSKCPGTTGYNVIPLNVPAVGTQITAEFTGLLTGSSLADDDPGQYSDNGETLNKTTYNTCDESIAGWRYGYVALLENEECVYGEMNSANESVLSFEIPEGCTKLWFVVVGAPSDYHAHPWDGMESNDEQWPYKVKFINTDISI